MPVIVVTGGDADKLQDKLIVLKQHYGSSLLIDCDEHLVMRGLLMISDSVISR